MSLIPEDLAYDLLDDIFSELSPSSGVRRLYVDGVELVTPNGNSLNSQEITSSRALSDFNIQDVQTGYLFFYPSRDDSLLDQSVPWQISFNKGVDQVPCNVLDIRQDGTAYGWNILVDQARREFAPNFTITWQLGQGTFTTEASSGNQIEATTEETVYAVMSQPNSSQSVATPGNDATRFYLEGYFCDSNGNPVKTPEGFQWGRDWPTVWKDDQTGLEHRGVFTAQLTAETPLKARPVDSGSQLQGWFRSYGTGAAGVG